MPLAFSGEMGHLVDFSVPECTKMFNNEHQIEQILDLIMSAAVRFGEAMLSA